MKEGLLCVLLVAALTGFAQTGPGGVGNSTVLPAWFRADAGTSTTTDLSPLSSWTDQSGNGYVVNATSVNQRPLYTAGLINAQPALFFDNAAGPNNDELNGSDNASLDNSNGITILTLTRPISINNSDARAIVSKRTGVGSNQAYSMFYYNGGNKMNFDIDGNGNRFASATSFVAGRDYVVTLHYDGTLAAGSRAKVFVNENLDITATESSTTVPDYASPLTIGSLNTGDGRPFGGYIAEVIIFRKALNTAERIIAHNYLFAKYGLSASSVPATTNDIYAGDDPSNGDFDFNVGGVGLASDGGNNQASSQVTGGLQMDLVAGFEAGDYLIYGHNSGTNGVSSSDVTGVSGANPARWTRIWFLDITNINAAETVNLTFDLSDGGTPATPSTAANYVLLTRAGQSGAWTEVMTATSIAGDQISFDNVTVSSDGYYTIGTRNLLNSPLPVGLLTAHADLTALGVKLSWTTATEINNDIFTIDRSADGEHFVEIATMKGAGTTNQQSKYHHVDPLAPYGKVYYRLSQTDFDGKKSLLKVLTVFNDKLPTAVHVYPNPATDEVVIETGDKPESVSLQIFNMLGQPECVTPQIRDGAIAVNTRHLSAGFYLFRIATRQSTTVEKVLVLRP